MANVNLDEVKAKMSGQWDRYFTQFTPLVKDGREWRGPCPLHGGHGLNLVIDPETGQWYCHSQCRKGGDSFSFIQELKGFSFPEAVADVAEFAQMPSQQPQTAPTMRKQNGRPPKQASTQGKVVAEYSYTDEAGETLFQVVRYDPKKFRQRRPDGDSGWINNTQGIQRVLYHLPEVVLAARAGGVVFVCEGEKDVDRLYREGLTATCNSNGAEKWEPAYTEALTGALVIVLPDNDRPGLAHAELVARSIHGVAASVKVVKLSGLEDGGDVSDWLEAGGTKEQLLNIVRDTPLWTPDLLGLVEGAAEPTTKPIAAHPNGPAPLHPAALYGLAGEIVRTIAPHTEADPVALLIQLLVAFGSVIGRSAHFMAEADAHYCNLYVVLVGQSSKARKGTSWGHIRRLFEAVAPEWTKDHIVSGLSSGEGLIHAVRDPVEKEVNDKETGEMTTIIVDPGVEDKRLLVQESEFASVLKVAGRDGSTLSAILRNFWDCGNAQTMTKREPARAIGAHVSVVGHITREELRHDLSSTESANGFGNRFLWCFVRRSKELPEGGNLEEGVPSPLIYQLKKAIDSAPTTSLMRRDEQARQLWYEVYHDLSEGKPGLAGALTSRAEAQVMRLACLYALLDCSPEIHRDHLAAGLALWEYSEESARHIFGESLGDWVADEILDKLRDTPGGLTRTNIRDLFQKNQTSERIKQALALLSEHNRAWCQMVPTNGKPAETWFVATPVE